MLYLCVCVYSRVKCESMMSHGDGVEVVREIER